MCLVGISIAHRAVTMSRPEAWGGDNRVRKKNKQCIHIINTPRYMMLTICAHVGYHNCREDIA